MSAEELETCSWCVEEVPDSQLRETPDSQGARLCRDCRGIVVFTRDGAA